MDQKHHADRGDLIRVVLVDMLEALDHLVSVDRQVGADQLLVLEVEVVALLSRGKHVVGKHAGFAFLQHALINYAGGGAHNLDLNTRVFLLEGLADLLGGIDVEHRHVPDDLAFLFRGLELCRLVGRVCRTGDQRRRQDGQNQRQDQAEGCPPPACTAPAPAEQARCRPPVAGCQDC